ncbi:PPOX class F420-dependent oxidoreductase [Jiangella asiatica]|uniref:PPOX class F420-dependent oxidoreductase n=1 Tax=Jiangella asiatica TaxID=2530372 RepID=A0A4R5CGT2_9ACTN|nr:PPOX class F420-dependent oxidoreductase [Jiangella asiatica]TDD98915.1 PPOX class F420-dependent oxidoreductase [Jiangella asiatica]
MTSTFTDSEIAYLTSQRLGRLATVGPGNRPQLAPVGVFFDPATQTIVVAGHEGTGMARSQKFHNARQRPDVTFIVDDLISVDPYLPRALEVRGRAETADAGGEELGRRITTIMPFDPAYIRIHPRRILSRGIDSDPFELLARDVG